MLIFLIITQKAAKALKKYKSACQMPFTGLGREMLAFVGGPGWGQDWGGWWWDETANL